MSNSLSESLLDNASSDEPINRSSNQTDSPSLDHSPGQSTNQFPEGYPWQDDLSSEWMKDVHQEQINQDTKHSINQPSDEPIDQPIKQSKVKRLFVTVKHNLKSNFIPGLVLNSIALGILLSYFFTDPMKEAFAITAQWKKQLGPAFAVISTCIFAGIIPSIFMICQQAYTNRKIRKQGLQVPKRHVNIYLECIFLCLFWTCKGIQGDYFYQFQAYLYGSGGDPTTVAKKACTDMFGYCVIWAIHQTLLAYFFKDANFNIKVALKKMFSTEYWTYIFPSTIMTAWAIWIPATSIIYCMPVPLQIPINNIIACFWSILMQLASKQTQKEKTVDLLLIDNLEPSVEEPIDEPSDSEASSVKIEDVFEGVEYVVVDTFAGEKEGQVIVKVVYLPGEAPKPM